MDLAVSADGIPIAYEAHGAGEPALVFVHGWSCDRSYWRGQVLPFARRSRVVAIDLAGHGESGVGRAVWTMAAFGDDVVAVVEELHLEDVVLIGHSMGGDVIVDAGLRLAERTIGLVWVDTYTSLGEPDAPDEIASFVAGFRRDFVATTRAFVRGMFVPGSDPDLVEWVVADMSAAPTHIAIDAMEHAVSNDRAMPDLLRELTVPVVAINPDHPPTDVEALRRHGVSTVLMSGVGHFGMLEDPETFNRVLTEIVATFTR